MLLATGLVIGWPVLSGDPPGYYDNPVHIAEIHSLARDRAAGWSDLAACGIPLGTLHSPL